MSRLLPDRRPHPARENTQNIHLQYKNVCNHGGTWRVLPSSLFKGVEMAGKRPDLMSNIFSFFVSVTTNRPVVSEIMHPSLG